MTRQPLGIHGATHAPDGQDPIPGQIGFDTDNEGGWLFIRSEDPITGVDADYNGKGIALVDGDDDGIVIDSDSAVDINTVQGGAINLGHGGNAITLDGNIDAGGNKITNGADGVSPTDFATVEQLGGFVPDPSGEPDGKWLTTSGGALIYVDEPGVTSLDSITGDISLISGSNITISPNTPSAGDITIAATGSGGGALPGNSSLVYRYTVTGSDKASIDTGVDTPDAGSSDWTNGDLLEIFLYSRTDEASVRSLLKITLNNDTSSSYDLHDIYAIDTSVSTDGPTLAAANFGVNVNGASCAANYFSSHALAVPDFANTVGYKRGSLQVALGDSTAANVVSGMFTVGYRSTSAISRLAITPATGGKKLKVGTQLLIYKRLAS